MPAHAEDNLFSASDAADLDDDVDNNLPLIELARRALNQARSDGPWKAIKPAAVEEEEEEDVHDDVASLDQDDLLQVTFHSLIKMIKYSPCS